MLWWLVGTLYVLGLFPMAYFCGKENEENVLAACLTWPIFVLALPFLYLHGLGEKRAKK